MEVNPQPNYWGEGDNCNVVKCFFEGYKPDDGNMAAFDKGF